MFGGPIPFPKKAKPVPWPKKLHDLHMPSQHPYIYAHNARTPNTNYSVRLLHYKQRLRETLERMTKLFATQARADKLLVQYFNHYEKKDLQRDIKNRVEEKLKAAEEALERRREKLLEMLSQEERQFYYETVDQAQRGKESKLAEMKERAETIKARKEVARLKLVEEKRFLQYRDQNELLRPAIEKLHNIEAKIVNLQQMRENESKRQSEREMESFFHKIMLKNAHEKMLREEQDAIRRGNDVRETVETWDRQLKGKEILKKEIDKAKEEDREEIQRNMQDLKAEIEQERLKILKDKQMRKEDLTLQIETRSKFLEQRQQQNDMLDRALAHLNSLELAKEKKSGYESRMQARNEMMKYRKYVADLNRKRMEEEKQIQAVLDADQNEILRKQDEVTCKIKAAKDKLRDEVYSIRAHQLEEKKERHEKEREQEREVAEFMKKSIEVDLCLDKECERLKKEETLQYRDDLCKQMEYNKLIKEREKTELQREQNLNDIEEQRYLEIVNKMVQEKIEGGSRHPFREVLEDFECFCKKNGVAKLDN